MARVMGLCYKIEDSALTDHRKETLILAWKTEAAMIGTTHGKDTVARHSRRALGLRLSPV